MEDKKIKECWVLLQDCHEILPQWAAKRRRIAEHIDMDTSFQSSTYEFPGTENKLDLPKGVSVGEMYSMRRQLVNGLKTSNRFRKKYRKRRNVNMQTSPAENYAKRHLLQKYGKSLLRKPSFSVEPFSTKHEIMYSDALKGKPANTHPSETADAAIKRLFQTPSFIISGNKEKNALSAVNPKQLMQQSVLKSSSQRNDKIDRMDTKTSTSDLKAAIPPLGNEMKSSNVDFKSDSQINSLEGKSSSACSEVNIKLSDVPNCDSKSDPPTEVIRHDFNCCYTNPASTMPPVGLLLNVGISHVLRPQEAKCVLQYLDECKGSLTSQYAEFCSSVVKISSQPLVKRMILPVKDKRALNFMQYKWSSRSSVKLNKLVTLAETCSFSNACIIGGNDPNLSMESSEKSVQQISIPNVEEIRDQKRALPEIEQRTEQQQNSEVQTGNRKWRRNEKKEIEPAKEHKQENHNVPIPKRVEEDRCTESKISYIDLADSDNLPESGASNDRDVCSRLTVQSPHKMTLLSGDKEKSETSDDNCKGAEDDALGTLKRRRSKRNSGKASLQNILSERFTAGSDDAARTVVLKTIAHIPDPVFDPDDTRGIIDNEGNAKESRELTRDRSSLVHELRRLNVALFDVSNSSDAALCKTPEICRLGCVCSSISAKVVRDNCGLVKCMFRCTCIDPQPSFKEETSLSFTWAQNKAKENLAKEEQNFKQTVVRSGSDIIIHVESKKKREIKLPGRYREDFFISDNELALRQAPKKVMKSPETEDTDQYPNMLQSSKRNKFIPNYQISSSSDQDSSLNQENGPNAGESHNSAISKSVSFSKGDFEPSRSNRITNCIPSRNVAMKSTSKPPAKLDNSSARTRLYSFGSKEYRLSKQKTFLENSSCDKINAVEGLQIESTKSLQPSDWEELGGGMTNDVGSCSFLFDPDEVGNMKKDVVLLSWEALRSDIEHKSIYLWLKTLRSKPKIYVTKDFIKPSEDCVEFQTIDLLSEDYKMLPFHLKTLRADYNPIADEGKCTWIAKYQKFHWMIVGYLQPGHNSEKEVCETQELDIVTSLHEDLPCRWWVMDIGQDFDLLYFLDFQKAITKAQITTLAKLSNEYAEKDSVIYRIVLNRRRPKVDPRPVPYPDFGAYSLPKRPNEVLIGPYYFFKEPRFLAYTKKVALNGKEEYEVVPLFYCGGKECVRVNSQGALSLHSESLPDKYVLGTWIPDFSHDPSELPCPLTDIKLNTHQCVTGDNKPMPDFVDLTETDSIEDRRDGKDIDLVVERKNPSELSSRQSVLKRDVRRKPQKSMLRTNQQKEGKTRFDSSSESNPANSAYVRRPRRTCASDKKLPYDSLNAETVNIEYLVPSEEDIGYLALTHLPRGAISVCHFTERGLLNFYHNTDEVIKHINHFVHNKLACMSRKCSIVLKDECRCVTWTSSTKRPQGSKFKCKIFSGFFMLTKYGLVDLRCADETTIRMLGNDWIEWLKNDEVRAKLADWKMKEEQELSRRHNSLSEVLNQNPNLSLPEVLQRAKSEIAKLKAEGQLLDYESQTQQLLKETLTYSLSRKLSGIPNGIMPHFLQQLDLDLLWDVLECMESRDTLLSSENPPPCQFSFESNDASNNQSLELSPIKMKPPIILRKSKPPATEIPSPVRNVCTVSNHVTKQARKQIFSKLTDKEEEPVFLDESKPSMPVNTARSPIYSQTSGMSAKLTPETGGTYSGTHDCVSSPTALNAGATLDMPSVEAAYSPLSTGVKDSSAAFTVEETDPISSLRISSVQSGADRLFSSLCSSAEDSNTTSSSVPGSVKDTDPISSLRITSVYSGARPIVSSTSAQFPSVTLRSKSLKSSIMKRLDPISSLRISSVYSGALPFASSSTAGLVSSADKEADSSMPLRISAVYSTVQSKLSSGGEMTSKCSSTEVRPTTSVSMCNNGQETDPISSLRISSVFSEAKAISSICPETRVVSSGPSFPLGPDVQRKSSDSCDASTSHQRRTTAASESSCSSSGTGGKRKKVTKPILHPISSEQKVCQTLSSAAAVSTTVGNLKHLSVAPKGIGGENEENSVKSSEKRNCKVFSKTPALSTTVGNLKHLSVMSNDGIKQLKLAQPPDYVKDLLNQNISTVKIVKKGNNAISLNVPVSSLKNIDSAALKIVLEQTKMRKEKS